MTPVRSFTASLSLRAFGDARFLRALAGVALASGAVGAIFTIVLQGVERLAFGFTTGTLAEAISHVPPLHRLAAVALGGMAVALAWYVLRTRGPRIPSVDEIGEGAKVSPLWMLADTTLQVVNVGLGASIGREGAPRQVGALAGALGAQRLGLDIDVRRVLVACGAGAGLAAIYNVPFGGACFAVEAVLGLRLMAQARTAAWGIAGSALACSWLATWIARGVVPDRPTYAPGADPADGALLLFALVAGPLLGAAGGVFGWLIDRARRHAATGAQILWRMPLAYFALALIAIPFPLVLGNGHAMAQNVLAITAPLGMVAALAIAKPIATLLTMLAGASGGRLTPSLATGAAAGVVLAALAEGHVSVAAGSAAIVGAAAFLAGATRAPLTAAVLALEFTGAMAPAPAIVTAVAGASAVTLAWQRRRRVPAA